MKNSPLNQDITLVGGGIMSLTLAVLIKEVYPNCKITVIERLNQCAMESSQALNNAGTGHAGNCELNYTPMKNNIISLGRAIEVNEMFETSLQFWAYLDKKYQQFKPKKFLRKTPHISFVKGETDVAFLKKRYEALSREPLFNKMEFTSDQEIIKQWAPLLISENIKKEVVAATKIEHGTDVNFGELTNQLLTLLMKKPNFNIILNSDVIDIKKTNNNEWIVYYSDLISKKNITLKTSNVFIGAGGKAISLLQKMKVKEAYGYAGFPVSGKWLVCSNPSVVNKHNVKVYGQALPKSPPMSIPHLDLRVIGGKKTLMFGPFAGFTLKFLKHGSFFDLPKTIKINNIKTMVGVFFKNLNLLLYLIKQSLHSHKKRMQELRNFYPEALDSDWSLLDAGQRVQIMKKCPMEGSKLEFGTEIIFTKDKKLSALIGASPGASVSAHSMLNVLTTMFNIDSHKTIKEMVPGYGVALNKNPKKLDQIRDKIYSQLGLD